MYIEILITAGIVLAAVYLLYKNIKRKSAGKCDSCSEGKGGGPLHCPNCLEEKAKNNYLDFVQTNK